MRHTLAKKEDTVGLLFLVVTYLVIDNQLSPP